MHAVDNEVETIHLYVVRDPEKKPYTLLPLLCALFCLAGIAAVAFYSAGHPAYEHQRLTVPAELLPPKTFRAAAPIIPTGIKTYPATAAHGTLTITNGSVISQTLPAGVIFITKSGISIATDYTVFIPAGNADGFGSATVAAHALVVGKAGNIPPYAMNQVAGTSVYIRNLTAFRGGREAYSVKFITPHDKQAALDNARQHLAVLSTGLHYPCSETVSAVLVVTWHCQFVTYHIPAFYYVTGVQLFGKNLLLTVWFVARPVRLWVR